MLNQCAPVYSDVRNAAEDAPLRVRSTVALLRWFRAAHDQVDLGTCHTYEIAFVIPRACCAIQVAFALFAT